jgi:hypothetical protein
MWGLMLVGGLGAALDLRLRLRLLDA